MMKIYAVSMATISNTITYMYMHCIFNLFRMAGAIVCFNDSPKVLLSPQQDITPVAEVIEMIGQPISDREREKDTCTCILDNSQSFIHT